MPTLDIEGVGKVKIDDADWNNLNNQGKQDLVNRIAREGTSSEPREMSTAESLAGGGRTALQGLTLGFGDEAEAGLRTGFGLLGDYDATVADIRSNIKDFRRENPATALGLELGGGLLTGGLGAARAAGTTLGREALKRYGTTGFGAGVGATEGAIAGVGAGEDLGSRVTGGLIGGTFGGALGGAIPSVINVGKGVVDRVSLPFRGDKAVQAASDKKIVQGIERSDSTVEDVADQITGTPNAMIADVGTGTQRLTRGAAGASGEGAEIAQKNLDERMLGLGDEIADDINKVFDVNKSSMDVLDDIANKQKANANVDYDNAFNLDGKPVTVSSDKVKPFLGLPAFDEAIDQARSLAKLEGFDLPNNIGDLSKIDNFSIKELHYIKMGLDEVLGLGKRGASKTSIGRGVERALKQKRNEFVKLIDDASPKIDGKSSYEIARNKFAGDARIREAVEEGNNFLRAKPEEIDRTISKLSDSEKQGYLVGVADAIKNSVDSAPDMANVATRIFGTPKKRKQLEALFPSKTAFEQFEKRMKTRINQVKTRSTVNVGSRTAPMQQDIDDVANIPTGFLGIPSIRDIAGKAINMTRTPEAVASRLARDLTETDPRQLQIILNRLANARDNLARQRQTSGSNIGITTGLLGQQLGLASGRGASE